MPPLPDPAERPARPADPRLTRTFARGQRVVVAAPDAFKGTAEASAVADAVAEAARVAGWTCDRCPLSDGGEGFAAVLAAARPGGSWQRTTVTGPLGRSVEARWWLAGTEAVVESAAASGLPLAGGAEGNDPVAATTRGTGELLVAARRAGARRILLGVGGSATTDGGRGAVEAVEELGGLDGVEVVVACDVAVRFVDAAAAFAPQKGADAAQVATLRHRLGSYAAVLRHRYGVDVGALEGSGAAGGLAGGLAALGARLVPGFDVVASAVGLEGRVAGADLVVTGEGRLDATSWTGKVVGSVLALAARSRVASLAVAGSVGPGGPEGLARLGDARVELRDLSARFGPDRALADPAGCVAAVVEEVLAGPVSDHGSSSRRKRRSPPR